MSTESAAKISSKRKQSSESSTSIRCCTIDVDKRSPRAFVYVTKDALGIWRLPQSATIDLPASEDHNSYRIKFLSGQVDKDTYLEYMLNDGNSMDWLLETLKAINKNESVNFRELKIFCPEAPHWNYAYDPLEEQKEEEEVADDEDRFAFKLLGEVNKMIIDGQVIEFQDWQGKNISGNGKGNYCLALQQNRYQPATVLDWQCLNWNTVKAEGKLNSNKMIEIKLGEFEFKGRK